VGATGFEPAADFAGKTPNCRDSAAKSGAVLPENAPVPAIDRVQALAAALRGLSPEDRARLVALLIGEGKDG
jgi:hypothetical protein